MITMDLRDLRHGPVEIDETITTPAEVWPDVSVRFPGPVRVAARAEPEGDGAVHVVGRLEATVLLSCRRCLVDVREELALPLDLWFRPGAEDEEGEAVFSLSPEARALDLAPALREELILAVPAFPVCRPDCPGLCPRCGARRDEEVCDCATDEPDSRWDALRALSRGA